MKVPIEDVRVLMEVVRVSIEAAKVLYRSRRSLVKKTVHVEKCERACYGRESAYGDPRECLYSRGMRERQ